MLVKDFIDRFYANIGDTEGVTEKTLIIEWMNMGLAEMAKVDGLEKLFEKHETINLAGINIDGSRAAGWDLDFSDEPKSEEQTRCGITKNVCIIPEKPTIIDIKSMRIIAANTNSDEPQAINICYQDYNDFFSCNVLPELKQPGRPRAYTFEQVGTDLKLIFDKPPTGVIAIDMIYSSFHKTLKSMEDTIDLPQGYIDILLRLTVINYDIASSDNSAAIAKYETIDKIIEDAVQLLARRKSYQGYRYAKRGF